MDGEHADPGGGRKCAHHLAEAERVGKAHRQRADGVAATAYRADPVAHGGVGTGGNAGQHESGALAFRRPQLGWKGVLPEQQRRRHPSGVADLQFDAQHAADRGPAAVEMALGCDAVASPGQQDRCGGRKREHQDADANQIALVERGAGGEAEDPGGDERPAPGGQAGESLVEVPAPRGWAGLPEPAVGAGRDFPARRRRTAQRPRRRAPGPGSGSRAISSLTMS